MVNCSSVTHHEKSEIENCDHCKTKFWFIKDSDKYTIFRLYSSHSHVKKYHK